MKTNERLKMEVKLDFLKLLETSIRWKLRTTNPNSFDQNQPGMRWMQPQVKGLQKMVLGVQKKISPAIMENSAFDSPLKDSRTTAAWKRMMTLAVDWKIIDVMKSVTSHISIVFQRSTDITISDRIKRSTFVIFKLHILQSQNSHWSTDHWDTKTCFGKRKDTSCINTSSNFEWYHLTQFIITRLGYYDVTARLILLND